MENDVKQDRGKKPFSEIEDRKGTAMGREKGVLWGSRERGELGKIPKAGSKPVAKTDWNRVARVRAVDKRAASRQMPEHQDL